MLFFLSIFLFLSSSHHLLALRRVLHQPFFPVESPPFFPLNPSSPPPPPSPASLPANLSSLIIPPASKSPSNSRKLLIFVISAVTSTAFVSGFILLLYFRSRNHGCNHSDDNKTHPSDSSHRVDQPPETIISKERSTSSEFLYLTTPVTPREPEDQSLCNRSLTGSISRNVESPDLHNLPPLSFHVNPYVDSMGEEEDTEEEFYSPKGSSSTLSRAGFESQAVLAAISGVESKSLISCSLSSSGSPGRSTFISISPSMSPTHTKSESNTVTIAIPETSKSSLGSSGSSSPRVSQGSSSLSLASLSLELSHVKQLPMESGLMGIVVDPKRSSRSPSLSSSSNSPEIWPNRTIEAHLLSTSHSSAFTSPDRNFQKNLDSLPVIMNNLRQGLQSQILSSVSSPVKLPKVSSPNMQSPSASSPSDSPERDFSQNVDLSPKILHISAQIVQSPASNMPVVGASRMPPTPPPPPPLPSASLMSDSLVRDFSESIDVSPKTLHISTKIVQSPTSNMPAVGASRVSPKPPPPPPLPLWPQRNQVMLETRVNRPSQPIVISNQNLAMSSSKELPETSNGTETSEETPKPKLKALHWDKVRASSGREMVWDHLRSSSFTLDEEMIETLFVAKITDAKPCQTTPKSIPVVQKQENRVLDPKKAQNISILLRALNVTKEEVCEALLEGNADTLGTELLENLLKMQPTKEEERKLKEYRKGSDSPAKLGYAEKFLMAILDIPSAFKRLEAMLYISNFDSEVEYLNKSFETLQAACKELRNSRMFLKLLEAILKTGNRMNVGTARGDAHAFKLDTLLKLIDVKGTDGKTTLLHFVVQEIIRLEGNRFFNSSQTEDINSKKLSLQVVSILTSELSNVKKAAAMDSEILSNDVLKLSQGISKIKDVIESRSLEESNVRFRESMNMFLKKAEEEIIRIQGEESLAVSMVKEITEYFHGNTEKEEAHPFRIFLVVRDFIGVVNRVCKDVEIIDERRTLSSSVQKFPVPMNPMLPRALPGLCGQKQCASSTSFSSDDEINSCS